MNLWKIYIAIYICIPLCWAPTGSGGGKNPEIFSELELDSPEAPDFTDEIPKNKVSGPPPKVPPKGVDSTPKSPPPGQHVKSPPSSPKGQAQLSAKDKVPELIEAEDDESDDEDEEKDGTKETDLLSSLPSHSPKRVTLEGDDKETLVLKDGGELRVTRLTDEEYDESLFFINTRVLFFAHNLQIITISNDIRRVNDRSQYTTITGFDGYIYEMNGGTKCVCVEYLNRKVWEHEEGSSTYPDQIQFTTYDPPAIVIQFPDGKNIYTYIDTEWKLQTDSTKLTERLDPNKIVLITSDDVFGSSSAKNDPSKYEVIRYPELKLNCYSLKENSNLIGLNYQDSNVWSHGREHYGYEFPTNIFFHTDSLTISIQFPNFYLIYKFDQEWKFDRRIYTNYFSDEDIEIITYSHEGSSNVSTNDKTKYDLVKLYYLRDYKFLEGARCPALKYKKKQVWVRHHLYNKYYPKSIKYNLETHTFFIDFDKDWFYVYTYDDMQRKWYLSYYDETKKPADLPDVLGQARKEPLEKTPEIVKQRKYTGGTYEDYESHLPEFDDEPDYSSSFFIVQKYEPGGKLQSLYANRKRIWENDQFTNKVRSVLFEPNLLLAAIVTSKSEFLLYGYNGTDWIRKKPSPTSLIELDINDTKPKANYKYEKNGNLGIFTPLDDHYFTKIYYKASYKRGTHNSYLWQSKTPFESCIKVEVYSTGTFSPSKEVILYFVDGSNLSYFSSGNYDPFTKSRWSVSTTNIPKDFNIFTSEDGTPTKTNQNDITKFYMYKYTRTVGTTSEVEIYKFAFYFFENAKCTLFKRKSDEIWKYKDEGYYPNAITFDLVSNKGYVEFKDTNKNYEFNSDLLKEELESTPDY